MVIQAAQKGFYSGTSREEGVLFPAYHCRTNTVGTQNKEIYKIWCYFLCSINGQLLYFQEPRTNRRVSLETWCSQDYTSLKQVMVMITFWLVLRKSRNLKKIKTLQLIKSRRKKWAKSQRSQLQLIFNIIIHVVVGPFWSARVRKFSFS